MSPKKKKKKIQSHGESQVLKCFKGLDSPNNQDYHHMSGHTILGLGPKPEITPEICQNLWTSQAAQINLRFQKIHFVQS